MKFYVKFQVEQFFVLGLGPKFSDNLFGALLITAYLLRSKKGGSGPRCSLCFSESSEGVFWVQWTKEPVDGALAYFFPYKTPAEHYFTTNLGKRELGRGMGTPRNAKPGGEFYCCWVSFLKEAHKYSGIDTTAYERFTRELDRAANLIRDPHESSRALYAAIDALHHSFRSLSKLPRFL